MSPSQIGLESLYWLVRLGRYVEDFYRLVNIVHGRGGGDVFFTEVLE